MMSMRSLGEDSWAEAFATEDQSEMLDEFDDASPLRKTYCQQVSVQVYEEQTASETEKALQVLIGHLEKDPSKFKELLKKRKQEDLESGGLMSFLKARMLSAIQGDNYKGNHVTDEECHTKLEEVKSGMLKAFNYAQEAKGKRYSKRLAARKARQQQNDENTPLKGMMAPPIPPPPPPLPPPGLHMKIPAPPSTPSRQPVASTPLKDRNVLPTALGERLTRKPINSSMSSIHSEILSSNPLKRLKSTNLSKSPGGTPIRPRLLKKFRACPGSADALNDSYNPANSSEPLTQAFLRILEQKFRNIRTPSPSSFHNSSAPSPATFASPTDFSP